MARTTTSCCTGWTLTTAMSLRTGILTDLVSLANTCSVPESELKTLLFSNFVSQALRASMNKVALGRPATPMEPGSDRPVNDAQRCEDRTFVSLVFAEEPTDDVADARRDMYKGSLLACAQVRRSDPAKWP